MHIERGAAIVVALLLVACSRQETPAGPAEADISPAAPAATPDVAVSEPPAESGLAIKRGVVMAASDRSTFRPCDSQAELWLLDQTDGLLARTFGGEASTAPMILVPGIQYRVPSSSELQTALSFAG